jgi:diadenylate cyclase
MPEQRMALRLLEFGREIGVTGAIDIALFSVVVYLALAWLRRSRTAAAVRGALVLGGVYLAARQLNLALTSAALEAFFVVLLVASIVIFRDELRAAVERVASWSRARALATPARDEEHASVARLMARTLSELATDHTGALLVLEGRVSLQGHLEGGTPLDGLVSEPLLHSLFDPHSIGHDGAAVVRAGRITCFGCHLPLSTNFELLGHRGTRHAAALGLAERTDALCLVVSEERGRVSVARDGKLRELGDAAQIAAEIVAFAGQAAPRRRPWIRRLSRELPHALASIGIAVLLWLVLVHGSTVTQRTLVIPVQYADLDPEEQVAAIQPAQVSMTFAGTRRDFYFLSPANVKLVVPLADAKPGSRVVSISPLDVSFPADLTLKTIEPSHVVLRIAPKVEPKPHGK